METDRLCCKFFMCARPSPSHRSNANKQHKRHFGQGRPPTGVHEGPRFEKRYVVQTQTGCVHTLAFSLVPFPRRASSIPPTHTLKTTHTQAPRKRGTLDAVPDTINIDTQATKQLPHSNLPAVYTYPHHRKRQNQREIIPSNIRLVPHFGNVL